MLDSKLIDCFSEIALDKNIVNEIYLNEIKQTEIKKETDDITYDEIKCNKCNKSTNIYQIKSNNRRVTTRNIIKK